LKKDINITVVGSGYVGFSLALLLSQNNNISILDLDKRKIEKINNNISPIQENGIEDFLSKQSTFIKATTDSRNVYLKADFIIIATPTNYDEEKEEFDTSSVEEVIKDALSYNKEALIIIKSTVPVGFTSKMQESFNTKNIIFSPEFLREGSSLTDNLYPSRIIIGGSCSKSKVFANLLKEGSKKKDINILFMNSEEAESVKLFSNAYLAMRVSFFNELDTYAKFKDLNTKDIINGVSLDSRIGQGYNNPSFGYGGYCLPKDTKQLQGSYKGIPQSMISAIVESNHVRKKFIIDEIRHKKPGVVGIYRLIMKSGSDNFRSSAISDIVRGLANEKVSIILYEPLLDIGIYEGIKVINNIDDFKNLSDIILCNRFHDDLADAQDKIFTRDIFGDN
tara:strand:- start:23229 stop:24407 length:1179 start_codon:yes stop_codon:yes gene_type:complete